MGRHRRHHTAQYQRIAALLIQQPDITKINRRNQAIGLGVNRTDLDCQAQRPCGLYFDVGAEITDSRHNDPMQYRPSTGHQQPGPKSQHQRPSGHSTEQSQHTRRSNSRQIHGLEEVARIMTRIHA